MSKKDEALKLALEALKQIDEAMPFPVAKLAQKVIREALAEQPAQTDWEAVAADQAMTIALLRAEQPAQQQGPVAYSYTSRITGAQGFSHHPMPRFIDSESWDIQPLYTSPPASKPLTDDEILWLVPGLLDCLCDPYDYNKTGDEYASIPKDMIRLARAIEAAHGIKGDA